MKFIDNFKSFYFSPFTTIVIIFLFIMSFVVSGYFFTDVPRDIAHQAEYREFWVNLFPYMTNFDFISYYKSSFPFFGVLILNGISLLLILKVLITGKCNWLKGQSLSDVLTANGLFYIFTVPFFLEFIFLYTIFSLGVVLIFTILSSIWNILSYRFNTACNCEE